MILGVRQQVFSPFNGRSPLNLTHHDDIPIVSLKGIPYYLGEDHTTPIEHIKDVANLCPVHHFTKENVPLRLLVASLKGKALQWFRRLAVNFGDFICNKFKDK